MVDLREVESILNACIVSRKGGIPIESINDEFFETEGHDIPYLRLGYSSLYEFMSNLKSITTCREGWNDEVVYKIKDNNRVQHIVDLVSKQKSRLPKKLKSKKTRRIGRSATRRRERRKNWFKNKSRDSEGIITSSSEEESYFNTSNSYYESCDNGKNPVKITDPPKNERIIYRPVMHGQQLIGDDFLLQLAIRNLNEPIWRRRECASLRAGLCKSGQTIRGCTNTLSKVESLTNRVVIMLGAEDIYQGRSVDQMTNDYWKLLEILHERFAFSRSAIKICTVPPLCNLSIYAQPEKVKTLIKFNNFLRSLAVKQSYSLVDVHNNMTKATTEVEWDLFQLDARMVSGTQHPYVLFNNRGRKLVVSLLGRQSNEDSDYDYY